MAIISALAGTSRSTCTVHQYPLLPTEDPHALPVLAGHAEPILRFVALALGSLLLALRDPDLLEVHISTRFR